MSLSMKHDHYLHNFCFRYLVTAILNYSHGHVKSEHGTMGNTKIQLSYLLNPNLLRYLRYMFYVT